MSGSTAFSTARVFAGVRVAFTRRWATILALTLVFGLAPSLIYEAALRSQSAVSVRVEIPPAAAGQARQAPSSAAILAPPGYLSRGIGVVLAAFGLVVVGGRASAATLNALSIAALVGDSRSPGEILLTCLRSAGPLALAALLDIGALLVGAILVVPALIIFAAWSVLYPVLLTEKTTVLGAFRRSAELTRGYRWLILGLRGLIAAGWLLLRTLLAVATTSLLAGERDWEAASIVTFVLAPIVSTLTAVFYELLVGALYVELRRAKEGLAPGAADAVFA